jgi:DNA-binding transcriptional LysR family regulator
MIATPTEIANFIETYQTRHVSKAAIRLGVTQPTLTQSLQKLEEKIGSKLFYRTKQGMVPSKEGNLFYVRAHKLLDEWKEVGNQITDSRNSLSGKFRVGSHQSVGAYVLPHLFQKLSESAPGIEIELVHDFSRKITEQIISYEIEIGFVVNPVRHPDLILKKIGSDRVEFWKKKGLASVPKRLFADANLKQIETLLSKTLQNEFKQWSVVQTSSLEVVRELTASGQGVGVLPARVARLSQTELSIYQKSLPVFEDEVFIAYRKEVLSSAAGRELIKLATQTLSN